MLACNRTLFIALLGGLAPLAAPAATICVNPGGTFGCLPSIGAAIAAAAPTGDTISVAAGTYHEGGLLVDRSVDIVGAGAGATIVDASVGGGNGPDVFSYPNFAFPVTSTLSNLTIQHGARGVNAGGGNTVTIDNARITANGPESGAGIFNGSSQLYVKASLIDANSATDIGSVGGCDWGGGSGGGIGSLCGGGSNFISDSTITGNTASRWGGGMIVNDGRTVVENSTLSGNHANFPDPGLGGGALFVGGAFPDVLLRFSTVSNNTAAASGGGGGIQGDEKVKLYATLLQGNSGGDCAAGSNPTSLGYNIAGDASCPFAQPSDLLSTDARLGPLADNGGATPTQDPPMASPAVDRVPVEDCTVFADQRGVARPQHGACDVGAVEHVYTAKDLMNVLLTQITGAGPGNSLVAKFAVALAVFSDRHPRLACATLNALRHEVQAQSGKKIPAAKAAAIVETVGELEDVIGC